MAHRQNHMSFRTNKIETCWNLVGGVQALWQILYDFLVELKIRIQIAGDLYLYTIENNKNSQNNIIDL